MKNLFQVSRDHVGQRKTFFSLAAKKKLTYRTENNCFESAVWNDGQPTVKQSYIPNSLYNAKRRQVAEIIIKHIEAYPNDILAQGVLIDLAGIDNISRHGSYFGNASILEQMTMFPEWDKSKRIVK